MTDAKQPSRPVGVVAELDVASAIPGIAASESTTEALVLVRLFTEPIGLLYQRLGDGGLQPDELARVIVGELGPQLRERILGCGLSWTGELPTNGLRPPRMPSFLESRARVLREGPRMTVAVCTRDRPESLARLLDSLAAQQYERMRVLVVDNAPSDDRTRRCVSDAAARLDLHYVVEERPGLSWARNRALAQSDGEVIAWADDDEICDPWWAAELARGFVEVPDAAAVTGLIVPKELETESQALFERYSGVHRGRGFERIVYRAGPARTQSPLYPLPPFGSGGNMALRRDALNRIGGFDCALGAGTAAMAGEDTAALSLVMLGGGTLVYQPTAITRHSHRRDYEMLRRLLLGYGRGLGAYYLSVLLRHPGTAAEMLKLSRRALTDELSHRSGRFEELGDDFPRELLRANRIGLLQGPFMYVRSRLAIRKLPPPTPAR